MSWTPKPYPVAGDRVLTMAGVVQILSVDNLMDTFMTQTGELAMEDVHHLEAPIGGTAEQMEHWLGCSWHVIRSSTAPCTCTCGTNKQGCERMIVERGDKKTVNHVASPRCTCGDRAECCGMAL